MKKITVITIIFFMAANGAFADDPGQKLTRGIGDVVAAPFEIFKGIEDAAIEKGVFGGVTIGTLQGLANAITRAVKGVVEITTFPVIPTTKEVVPDPSQTK